MDSVFEDGESDFAPAKPAKATKAKATAPKKAAGPAKARGRPAKDATQAKPKATKAVPKKKKKRKDDSDDENSDVDIDEDPFDDDESLLADTPPQQKKAPGPKKTSGKPLATIANESFGLDGADSPALPAKKAGGASSKYQMVRLCTVSHRGSLTNVPNSLRIWSTS